MSVLSEGNELDKARVKPPMTGNDKHTTYRNGDDWEMIMALFYSRYIILIGADQPFW